MEPFDITLDLGPNETTLLVIPEIMDNERHEYRVYNGPTFIGKVWPDLNDNGTIWCTDALLSDEVLYEIGDKIEKYES